MTLMSRRNKNSKNRRRTRGRRTTVEPLEPRIVMDGSALGVIDNDSAVIPLRLEEHAPQQFFSQAGRTSSQVTLETGRDAGPFYFRWRPIVGSGAGDLLLEVISTSDHDSNAMSLGPLQPQLATSSIGDHDADQHDRTAGSNFEVDKLLPEHLRPSFVFDSDTVTLSDSNSSSQTSDHFTLDDPVMIPMPSQVPDILAAGGLPPAASGTTDVAHSNSQQEINDLADTVTGAKDATAPTATIKRHAVVAGTASISTNTKPAAALTPEQYFVDQAAHARASWSTQSSASESRQHVVATTQPKLTPAHHTGSVSIIALPTRLVGYGRSDVPASILVSPAGLRSAAAGPEYSPVAGDGRIEKTPWLTAHDGRITEAGDDLARKGLAARVYRQSADSILSVYQPISLLVGVSLVSAHLVAETHTAEKHRPLLAAARPRRVRRRT